MSIIEISEDESTDVNLADTEEDDTIQFSNLFTFSSLDHDEPHQHESITDIANSLQVNITEVDTEEHVFETWEPQEGFPMEDHGMIWEHDPTQYSVQILNVEQSFLANCPAAFQVSITLSLLYLWLDHQL